MIYNTRGRFLSLIDAYKKRGLMDFIGDFRGFRPDISDVLIPHMRSGEMGGGGGGNCDK